MSKYTMFSIIIPTLNEEKYLPKLLKCISKQYEANFEVIVVDGKSDDKTPVITKEWSKKLPLRLISTKKRQLAYQRNLGATKARGKYLIFLDADVQIFPSFTKRLAAAITHKGGLLFLPTLLPDENTAKNKVIFSIINAVIEASQVLGKPLVTPSAMFVEKNFFQMMDGYSENSFATEDHDFILRAKKCGIRARFLKNVRIVFSMRRVRKEGELVLFSKYFITTTAMLLKGHVKDGIFEYEMGGHMFEEYDKEELYREKKKNKVQINRIRQIASHLLN